MTRFVGGFEKHSAEFSSLSHSAPLLEPASVDYYSRTELDNETPLSSCPTVLPPSLAVGNLRERATDSRQPPEPWIPAVAWD